MDDRILRELELLPVARLYGLASPAVRAAASEAPTVETPPAARPGNGPARAALRAPAPAASPPVAGIEAMDWAALEETVRSCRRCVLCEQRKQAVFGVGNVAAPWLFVGEGPGADEDEKGEPFVGQAGKLLDSMLAAAKLARGREVYIANVVKCRPPGNRVPAPEEAAACAPFLDRQIDLIRPKLIVAMGKTAMVRLTGNESSLASQRGRVLDYRGIPLVITYHPAYLLRNLPDKAKAWEDLLFARRTFAAAQA
ncbi:MAG TPA: uracil-DNA glycosylase [Usitatibacteraceae bacterium]|nr:uracil-DNA glycosylase [Usitatibacteraceae bacterium]